MELFRGHSINWWFFRLIFIIVLTLNDPFILILPVNKIKIILSWRIHFNWTIIMIHFLQLNILLKLKSYKFKIECLFIATNLCKSWKNWNIFTHKKLEKYQNTSLIILLNFYFLEKSTTMFFIFGGTAIFFLTISSTFSFNLIN